jgi:hypothetical protein
MLKAFDYSHQLFIKSSVVNFRSFKLLGKEGNRVPFAYVLLQLRKDTFKCCI